MSLLFTVLDDDDPISFTLNEQKYLRIFVNHAFMTDEAIDLTMAMNPIEMPHSEREAFKSKLKELIKGR